MDLDNKKSRDSRSNNRKKSSDSRSNKSSEQGEDRITALPDSLLHYILSLPSLDIKEVARTSVLSKRWNYIWRCTPNLDLRSLDEHPSYRVGTGYFMDVVDRVLYLRDISDMSSTIKTFCLRWRDSLGTCEYRVKTWLSAALTRHVEELSFKLCLEQSFFTPPSLGTCESLVSLELDISPCFYLPTYMSFPKLKHLKLSQAKFSSRINDQQLFRSCPVLESLMLENCEWLDNTNFCLSAPSLKVFKMCNYDPEKENCYQSDGLRKSTFEVRAPSLESITYWGDFAKEYVMSNFLTLAKADVRFGSRECVATTEGMTAQGDNLRKFLQALSHVKHLKIYDPNLQVLSLTHDLRNNLPTFHNLEELNLTHDVTNYKALIALLRSAPNLKSLVFSCESCYKYQNRDFDVSDSSSDSDGDTEVCNNHNRITTKCLFPHLKSVRFEEFEYRHHNQMEWVTLILEKARNLELMSFDHQNQLNRNEEDEFRQVMKDCLKLRTSNCDFDLGF